MILVLLSPVVVAVVIEVVRWNVRPAARRLRVVRRIGRSAP